MVLKAPVLTRPGPVTVATLKPVQAGVLALGAGGLYPLAFAPFDLWWLALLAIGVYWRLVRDAGIWRATWLGYLFGLGAFGIGASWVYVSINVYGGAGPLLAGFLVGLFVCGIATFFALHGFLFAWSLARVEQSALAFALLWPLTEWVRSWLFTGFPWLYAGYAYIDTPLANFAPFAGVLGVSLSVAITGVALVQLVVSRAPGARLTWGVTLAGVWLLAVGAGAFSFAVRDGEALTVSAIQPNINQNLKWRRDQVQVNINTNEQLSATEWGRDLVVWSEASLTFYAADGRAYLDDLDARARAAGSALILGIPERGEGDVYYNAALGLGTGTGAYRKRHLVPFGEYVPLEEVLRGLIAAFDLPMSRNSAGSEGQEPIEVGAGPVALAICYEIAFGDLVRSAASDPVLLVTMSNDTWFGASIGPWQHLQMARMRARELARYLVRATNNGISAVVDPAGRMIAAGPQFEPAVIRAEVYSMSGRTPYLEWGVRPFLSVLVFVLAGLIIASVRRRIKPD